MEKPLEVTRIDMSEIGPGKYQVVRFAEGQGFEGKTIPAGDPEIKEQSAEDVRKRFSHYPGWVLREFPGGFRAWKGDAPRSVRSRNSILRKAEQLRAEGKNSAAWDLRYDLF